MRRLVATAAISAFLAIACGDDNGDTVSNSPTGNASTATVQMTSGPSAAAPGSPGGTGSGTLDVDGHVFEFAVIFCGFTPAETKNDNVSFSFRGDGTAGDGRTFSVDASTVNISVAGMKSTSHTVQMWYNDDQAVVVYGTQGGGATPRPEFDIDGKHVRFEGAFGNAEEDAIGSGVLDATCP